MMPVHVPAQWKGEPVSLRDYFAAAAMQGMLSQEGAPTDMARIKEYAKMDAKRAYIYADAMLAEKEKK